MKKALVILALVAVGVGFTACKKDCRCIIKDSTTVYYDQNVGKMSKSDCESYNIPGYDDMDVTLECKPE